jgi:hypothetical protein
MFARQKEMQHYAKEITELGHEVTSTWLRENFVAPLLGESKNAIHAAELDLHDILTSDAMIIFTEDKSIGNYAGGRHVEFGFAIGNGVTILSCGPKENIFYHLPKVRNFTSWDDIYVYLLELKKLSVA